MQIRRVEPVFHTSFNMNKEREKQNEQRRQALLLKKAVLEEMKKQQESIHKSWINRGR